VESVPERGTTIKVYLPLAQLEVEAMEPIPLPASYEKQSLSEGW